MGVAGWCPTAAGAAWTACLLSAGPSVGWADAESGAGLRARERERENTETALVEVTGAHRTCSPAPPCSTIHSQLSPLRQKIKM